METNWNLLLDKGIVLRNQYIFAFKFLGNYYSTNLKRTKRYSFDDIGWKATKYEIVRSTIWKLEKIILGKAKRLE